MLPDGIKSTSILINWGSILFCVVVLFASYEAELTTELSVVISHLPFTSLAELYHNTDFKVVAEVETSNLEFFEVTIAVLVENV